MLKTNLPKILLDNDAAYLEYIENNIRSVDTNATVSILRGLTAICWHIRPSHPDLKQPTVKAILRAHTAIGIRVTLASTINTSPFINFQLPFET